MVFGKEDVATPTSEAFWEEMQEYEKCVINLVSKYGL